MVKVWLVKCWLQKWNGKGLACLSARTYIHFHTLDFLNLFGIESTQVNIGEACVGLEHEQVSYSLKAFCW